MKMCHMRLLENIGNTHLDSPLHFRRMLNRDISGKMSLPLEQVLSFQKLTILPKVLQNNQMQQIIHFILFTTFTTTINLQCGMPHDVRYYTNIYFMSKTQDICIYIYTAGHIRDVFPGTSKTNNKVRRKSA